MNGMPQYYYTNYKDMQAFMSEVNFVVSIEDHAELVTKIVKDFVDEAMKVKGYTPLRHQFQFGAADIYSCNQFLNFQNLE